MKLKTKTEFSRKNFAKIAKKIITPQKLGDHQLTVLSIS